METKKIVDLLLMCAGYDACKCCYVGASDVNCCVGGIMKEAAERLEELDAELKKRTINDRPYEWISVEDEPIPGEQSHIFTVLPKIIIKRNPVTGEPAYWMRLEPPKPKEPSFKDVFLKAFSGVRTDSSGVPIVAACSIFPILRTTIGCKNKIKCSECWNQPYFEEEGEADA